MVRTAQWVLVGAVLACKGTDDAALSDSGLDPTDPDPTGTDVTDTDATDTDTTPVFTGSGAMRIAQLAPDLGTVDVFTDGYPYALASAVPPMQGSNDKQLPAGPHPVDVAPTGVGIDSAALSDSVVITTGGLHTLLLSGSDAAATLGMDLYLDDATGLASSDTRFHVIHGHHAAGPVGLLVDGAVVVSGLAFRQDASFDVPAGPVTVGLDVDDDGDPDFNFAVPEVGASQLAGLYLAPSGGDPILLMHAANGAVSPVPPAGPAR